MKAVVIEDFGSLEQLKYVDLAKPNPAAGQILVKVEASGLNPVDEKLREGHLADLVTMTFPRVLGGDVSGVVESVGEGVTHYHIGDEVYFSSPLSENGGNAEYVVVDAAVVALKPESLSHAEAATLPVVALTAVQALRDFSQLKSGDKVLIHAGAGGVGSIAIQYAKHLGATVYTTASSYNAEKVKNLGADFVIDYKKADFQEIAKEIGGFDIVLESVGGDNYLKSIQSTKIAGRVPSIVNPPNEKEVRLANEKNIKTDFMLLSGSHEDLKLIASLVDEGVISTSVGHSFPLEDAPLAHAMIASGKNVGKIVVLNRAN